MKVLFTYCSRFIDSALVKLLLNKGLKVKVLDSLRFTDDGLYFVSLSTNLIFFIKPIY